MGQFEVEVKEAVYVFIAMSCVDYSWGETATFSPKDIGREYYILSYENPDNYRLLNQLELIEMIVGIDNCVPFWEYLLFLANF